MGKGSTAKAQSPQPPSPHWPSNVEYLSSPFPSPLLPNALRLIYCSPAPIPPTGRPSLEMKKIELAGHPAKGQFGLFNGSKKLAPGQWIRDYIGVVHTEEESDLKSDYDLALEPGKVGCDATHKGNEARMVNDYRGILDRPNAKFDLRSFPLEGVKGEGVRMAIFAGPHGVEKGSEICVSYGKGFWDKRRAEESVAEEEDGDLVKDSGVRDGEENRVAVKMEGVKGVDTHSKTKRKKRALT